MLNATRASLLLINTTNTSKILDKHTIEQSDPRWLVLLRVILLSAIALLAIIGNSLVLTCVCKIKEMKTVTGVFLANLAASDLCVAFFCITLAIAASFNESILNNYITCHFNGFTLVLFFISSIQTLSAISVHKYIAVVHAMQTTVNKKRACVALASIWILSLVLAAGPIFGWSDYVYELGRHQCGTKPPDTPNSLSHIIMLLLFGYVLPVVTMVFCYSRLYCTTKRHIQRLKTSAITNQKEANSERQLINTLFIILLTFILCWLPFVVYITYGLMAIKMPYYLPSIAFLFGYGNSAVNPIIYALRHRSFRKGFWEILTVCFNENVRNRFATTASFNGKYALKPIPLSPRKTNDLSKDGQRSNSIEMHPVVAISPDRSRGGDDDTRDCL